MDYNRNTTDYVSNQSQARTIDQGLRSYMLKIYNYMGSALALTGIVALMASQSQAFLSLMFNAQGGMNGIGYLIMFAPLGFVFALSMGLHKFKTSTLQALFWAYAAVNGLALSFIFLAFTGESIARTFFIVAGMFGAMSIWGYTTKKDLTGMGNFLMMGVIGLIIASVVNIFLQSSGLQFAVSAIGVLVFTGLTAYDTQKLKNLYYQVAGYGDGLKRVAIMGALNLYLDFINMFVFMLQFMGDRR